MRSAVYAVQRENIKLHRRGEKKNSTAGGLSRSSGRHTRLSLKCGGEVPARHSFLYKPAVGVSSY